MLTEYVLADTWLTNFTGAAGNEVKLGFIFLNEGNFIRMDGTKTDGGPTDRPSVGLFMHTLTHSHTQMRDEGGKKGLTLIEPTFFKSLYSEGE